MCVWRWRWNGVSGKGEVCASGCMGVYVRGVFLTVLGRYVRVAESCVTVYGRVLCYVLAEGEVGGAQGGGSNKSVVFRTETARELWFPADGVVTREEGGVVWCGVTW